MIIYRFITNLSKFVLFYHFCNMNDKNDFMSTFDFKFQMLFHNPTFFE